MKYFPYVIQFYSPTYLITVFQIAMKLNRPKISPEQLIGLTCDSVFNFLFISCNCNSYHKEKKI